MHIETPIDRAESEPVILTDHPEVALVGETLVEALRPVVLQSLPWRMIDALGDIEDAEHHLPVGS